jgi:hypothetical protein
MALPRARVGRKRGALRRGVRSLAHVEAHQLEAYPQVVRHRDVEALAESRALRWTYERWFLKRLPNGERLDIPMSNDLRVSFQLMGLDVGE